MACLPTFYAPFVKTPMRLPDAVWLLLDGLSQQLLTRLCTQAAHPLLQRCLEEGRSAALRPLSPNCQTPPSLFSIWSGSTPAEHGLTGYDVPCQQGNDPTASVDGFLAWPRDIALAWDRYAERGQPIRTAAVPFMDFSRLGGALHSATDVFSLSLLGPAVYDDGAQLRLPPSPWSGVGLTLDVRRDGAAVVVNQGARALRLALGESASWTLPDDGALADAGYTHGAVHLYCGAVDGVPKLISMGCHPVRVHGAAARLRLDHGRQRAFVASNPGKLYQDGTLGRRLDDGGSGAAEALLVALMYEVHCSFADDFLWTVRCADSDLTVAYYPVIDLLSHQILRHVLDPQDPARDGVLAPLMAQVLQWVDSMLAEAAALLAQRKRPVRFVAHADHGMVPLYRQIAPNRYLHDRGLLALCPNTGHIDANRSLMFMHPAENGLMVCHAERMRAAGLTLEIVLAQLSECLAPHAVAPLATVAGPRARLDAQWLCSTYLQAPSGTRLRAAPTDPLLCGSSKGGDHTVFSDEPWLRGILLDLSSAYTPFGGAATLELVDILPYILNES